MIRKKQIFLVAVFKSRIRDKYDDLGRIASVTRGAASGSGGKELITANGLNEYDFGARQYYQAVPHFTKPDLLCEKYYWLSPYLYCANNPVNFSDPTGMYIDDEDVDEWEKNKKNIEGQRNKLQNSIDKTMAKGK